MSSGEIRWSRALPLLKVMIQRMPLERSARLEQAVITMEANLKAGRCSCDPLLGVPTVVEEGRAMRWAFGHDPGCAMGHAPDERTEFNQQ